MIRRATRNIACSSCSGSWLSLARWRSLLICPPTCLTLLFRHWSPSSVCRHPPSIIYHPPSTIHRCRRFPRISKYRCISPIRRGIRWRSRSRLPLNSSSSTLSLHPSIQSASSSTFRTIPREGIARKPHSDFIRNSSGRARFLDIWIALEEDLGLPHHHS